MAELGAGDILGRYRIEAFLAEGGMGRVYRAFDTLLGRRVALKVLTDDAAPGSPEIARLVRGARAAAAFSHPNVCSVFDAGEVDGQPFIAMELVEGTSLRQLIPDAEIALGERLRWVLELAGALAAAHRARVVHRDIKPENVMVAADGRVCLLDFGVAKWEDEAPEAEGAPAIAEPFRTEAGRVIGTRGYMAPEQLDGGPVDARTDQFAWGVLAYEAIGGRRPFSGDGEYRAPPLVSTLAPALPFGVAAIVAKAMALAPAQRFADMNELVGQLAPLVGGAGGDRTRAGRRRRVIGALAALGVAMVLGGAGMMARGSRGRAAEPPLVVSHLRRVTFGEGCEEFPSFTPDGRALVYSGSDASGEFRIFRVELDDGSAPRPVVLEGMGGWQMAPAVSPRGDRVAFSLSGKERSGTYLAPMDGSAPPHWLAPAGTFPRWSLDGRGVWANQGSAVALYDADSGAALRTLALPSDIRAIWLFERPDGSFVAQVNQGGPTNPTGLAVFAADGTRKWRLDVDFEPAIALAPDADALIAARQTNTGEAELVAIPLDGSPIVPVPSAGIVPRDGLAISPDGRRLAWSTCHPLPQLVAVDAAAQLARVMTGEEDAVSVAWNPGTRELAVVSGRSGKPELWVMNRDGARPPRKVPIGDRVAREVAVSPDGTRFAIVVQGVGIGVGSITGDPAFHMLTSNPGDSGPSFRHAGEQLLFTRRLDDGTSQVMGISLREGPPVPLGALATHDVAASPVDDRVVFLAGERSATPMLSEIGNRGARMLSPQLPAGRYRDLRFSADGRRVALIRGGRELVEVDAASGAILRVVGPGPGDALYSPVYIDRELVVVRVHWQGSLWAADAVFRATREWAAPQAR